MLLCSVLSKQPVWSACRTWVNGPLSNRWAQMPAGPADRPRLSFTPSVPKGFPYNSLQALSAENDNRITIRVVVWLGELVDSTGA